MANKPFLFETERLGFREWLPKDAESFAALNADSVVMEYFPKPLTREETDAFIARISESFRTDGFGLYAVEEKKSGDFIGFIGFSRPRFEEFFTPCIEIGWRLAKEFWDKGYATEGAKGCLDHSFQVLGFQEVYSFTATTNLRSERIMQKIGMDHIGFFDHPNLAEGHVLRPHTLYKISR
jgi:ribosomal-protein-alanine N-acetyltransferase